MHDGLSGAHQCGTLCWADCGRTLRRGVSHCSRSESSGQHLRRVCAHPCETACRRGEIDKPIAIRALKRFLTERHGPESKNPVSTSEGRSGKKLPHKVAVIGGGPVGLSAAHDLALLGYSVTIFEASPVPGGMLYLGIPEYRLPRDVVEAQVREILETGDITLKLNHAAGRDLSVSDLRRQGFDAFCLRWARTAAAT